MNEKMFGGSQLRFSKLNSKMVASFYLMILKADQNNNFSLLISPIAWKRYSEVHC